MMNHIKLGSITQPDKRTLILIGQYKMSAHFQGKPLFSKQQNDGHAMLSEYSILIPLRLGV